MIKGSKHKPESLEKLRIARSLRSGPPGRKGIPISKNATIFCIDCGIVVTNTTVNRRRCLDCKKINVKERINKFKKDHIDKVRKENGSYWKHIRETCPERRDDLNRRSREWYVKNKEYCKEKAREWRINNPEIKHQRDNHRRAVKRNALGAHSLSDFLQLCDNSGWKCFYCGILLDKKTASRDHKIPLSRGGNDSIDNIAPSCIECNQAKHTKTDEEFFKHLLKAAA